MDEVFENGLRFREALRLLHIHDMIMQSVHEVSGVMDEGMVVG